MVDFAKLLADRIAAMSPEERARYDSRLAAEAALERLERPIASHWTYRDSRKTVIDSFERELKIRVEPAIAGCRDYEILRIIGGPTGFEAFQIDEDCLKTLFKAVTDGSGGDAGRWHICAGTPGRWHECWVSPADMMAYLDEVRPELMRDARDRLGDLAPPPRSRQEMAMA